MKLTRLKTNGIELTDIKSVLNNIHQEMIKIRNEKVIMKDKLSLKKINYAIDNWRDLMRYIDKKIHKLL